MNIKIVNENGNFIIYYNGKFFKNCNNWTEVVNEIELIEKEEFKDEICE